MNALKFSHSYQKLKKDRFTTIRRYPIGTVGDKLRVYVPNTGDDGFTVEIEKAERKTLASIETWFLLEDTETMSRRDAINLINSFYQTPIGIQEKLHVYTLRRI